MNSMSYACMHAFIWWFNGAKAALYVIMFVCLSVGQSVFMQEFQGVRNNFHCIKPNCISKKCFLQANKKTKPTHKNPQYSGHITLFFTNMFKYNSYLLHINGICQYGAMVHALGLFRSYAEKVSGLVRHLFIILCALT